MIDWKKAQQRVEMNKNIRRKKSSLYFGIIKSGALTLSVGLRDKLLEKNKNIAFAHPGYLKEEHLIMIEFLADDEKEGARKITNMHEHKGAAAFSAKAFFNQVGLDFDKLLGRYKAEPIDELDGEWWFFRLK